MLQIALPNKGSLSQAAIELVREAGYHCRRYSRELVVRDKSHPIEYIFLRPKDIAIYVSRGLLDLGITGRDLALDSRADFEELLPLQFGRSRFHYAVPQESDLTPERFEGLRVATSYANLVGEDLQARGVSAEVVHLDGAVEIAIRLGVADAIADVVESGRTMLEAGLKTVGEPLVNSEAILIARDGSVTENPLIKQFIERLNGIVVAREYVMVEYDAPKELLEMACMITPGIEAPTVAPLSREGWVAIKSMAKKKEVNEIMDRLADMGAKGIIVTPIRTCRI
ncbi:MAG: ATP phosphoribosyltransferase [Desulfosarcinaceae bacterium]|nr:ATP phosphoribosyltransferase [Desulfosarcinaceae bacterium]